ncbi:virulence factor TspB C-terminal domain-related protein [Acinetobacter pittii]|uniref:virulence factor TspB C-terminal domain-related protein n=1 Tax=Acinetobacter pittii TaxID=48296 RepID=UPI0032604C58
MGRYKKYLTILLMFSIHMMPFNAVRASTVAGEGWSVSKRLVQGATTFYDGTKNIVLNGKNYAAQGTAKITPAAGQVSKMIVRTGAILAVDLAIKSLIGAVDYVMDPANNQVKYYVVPPTASPSDQYYWVNGNAQNIKYSTSRAALDGHLAYLCSTGGTWGACPDQIKSIAGPNTLSYGASYTVTRTNNSTVTYNMTKVANPAYDPNAQPNREEKYLPYDAVASQLISDAAAEKAEGKAYVSSVADTALADEQNQLVPATDVINQLNNSQAIPTNNTATGTSTPTTGTGDPTAPTAPPSDITLNFPVFCDWAPTVCSAAQTVISFPQTLTTWWETGKKSASETWTEVKNWFKEPENTDNTLDLDVQSEPEPNTQISFSTSCPAKIPLSFSWNGQTLDFSFDFTIWCESISAFVYPIVVALGALHALYIVSGVRENG